MDINDFYIFENNYLSKFAKRSLDTFGRDIQEPNDPFRTPFQHDRDRILHSKAFRRLKHKTQVFLSPEGDHYRTRLTHTLEVSQISRSIARILKLNEDLVEAISLGHDLGHTPFGHEGEKILQQINPNFKHNEQSVRVVKYIEKNGAGLNLTKEVIDGIYNHTSNGSPFTLEAKVVSFADRIAYINHDIDDAIRAGILLENQLPKNCTEILGNTKSERITNLINNLVENSYGLNEIKLDSTHFEAMQNLRKFMFSNVYSNNIAKFEEQKVLHILTLLYEYYEKHIDELPPLYISLLDNWDKTVVLCDYIAGMTDRYAVKQFTRIFIPSSWEKI